MSDELLTQAKKIFGPELVIDVTGAARLLGESIDLSQPECSEGEVVIHFVNGRSVRFRTSEWGWIEPVSAHPVN